jgi:hypothetical protein
MAKGGKWVFGWAVVGPGNKIRIPPAAFDEYGFQPGEIVLLTRGSQRSGRFGIGRQEKLAGSTLRSRFLGQSVISDGGWVKLPEEAHDHPGQHLLVVRGSGLAPGFIQQGPIFDEAQRHPEIETHEVE